MAMVPPVSPHLKVDMALTFLKVTNYAVLGIIVREIHDSPIIVHIELIPCQVDPLWMAVAVTLYREPCTSVTN